MKQVEIILFLFLLFSLSCKEKVSDQESDLKNTDLTSINMKIIPENPTSKDEIKLVVYDDCTYNVVSTNKRTGKNIDIQKQFNSSMKWPCVIQNDSILIGKLPQGSYTVNYKLVDIATPGSPKIDVSETFSLSVTK